MRCLVLLLVFAGASGCDNTETPTTPTPTPPTPVQTTVTFTGTLRSNAARTFTFAASAGGTVSAAMKTVDFVTAPPQPDPDTPVTIPVIGFALGRYNADANTCTATVTFEQAAANSFISAVASGAGTFCLRVYDVGRVSDPLTFSVEVIHP